MPPNGAGVRAAEVLIRKGDEESEMVLHRRMEIPFVLPGTPCCSIFRQELISKAASHVCPLVQARSPLELGSLLFVAGHALHPLQRKYGPVPASSRLLPHPVHSPPFPHLGD